MYQIQVLLATYNGSKYIEEFLLSLREQSGVEIHLLVSDDGSSDETLEVIQRFSNSFASLQLVSGPKKGPAANFFFLMSEARNSSYDYFAFADQDDIWMPEHLMSSINRLREFEYLPALTFSRVQTITSGPSLSAILPKDILTKISPQIIFENPAKGCTIVFNKKLLQVARNFENDGAIMHDWWVLLIAYTFGRVLPSRNVEVLYRIHNDNFIGLGKSRFIEKATKFITGTVSADLHTQIHAFHSEIVRKVLHPIEEDLLMWHLGLHGNWKVRSKLLTKPLRLRVSKIESLLLRMYCFLGLFGKYSSHLETKLGANS
jgi:glycosyltransferase involved in cell wall biosynthesis